MASIGDMDFARKKYSPLLVGSDDGADDSVEAQKAREEDKLHMALKSAFSDATYCQLIVHNLHLPNF